MNKVLMYIQADMHRAINDGRTSMEISVLDMKELISAVCAAEGREVAERVGHGVGWINPDKLRDFRSGTRFWCTIRLRKNEEYSEQLFCIPEGRPPAEVAEAKTEALETA